MLWLSGVASLSLLLGITEMDFYREFHQRLNTHCGQIRMSTKGVTKLS